MSFYLYILVHVESLQTSYNKQCFYELFDGWLCIKLPCGRSNVQNPDCNKTRSSYRGSTSFNDNGDPGNEVDRCYVTQIYVISWNPKCPKSGMKHCNNHLKLLNIIKEIQQKERGAWMDTNGQDKRVAFE